MGELWRVRCGSCVECLAGWMGGEVREVEFDWVREGRWVRGGE